MARASPKPSIFPGITISLKTRSMPSRSSSLSAASGAGGGWQPTAGKLVENLRAAGIDPAKVTKVVFTHAHPDHLWGVADDRGTLRFPNASYFVAGTEWNFWMAEDV